MEIGLNSAESWNAEWEKWFARYSRGTPRLGMWLAWSQKVDGRDTLELGAGSGRESRFLAARARSVTCVDFSSGAMDALRESRPPLNLRACTMDARNLDFPDGAFDLSFHKGFWSCFGDDDDVALLFAEQLRVTRGTLLALVHNAANSKMHEMFRRKAGTDKLYQVRFYQPEELMTIARSGLADAGIDAAVRIRGFGGPDWMHRGLLARSNPSVQGCLAALAYRCRPLAQAESLVLEVRITNRHP
ncbi:MAG: class I SAM-dependent methyltransferase [Chthoniobacterales bacterium]|nr:class I SAM-dependent methyltransferase [Chthoniobacterales bacterium]